MKRLKEFAAAIVITAMLTGIVALVCAWVGK